MTLIQAALSLLPKILPVANEQLRNANEGFPLVVSCESANELCNLESQKLISNSV